MQVHDDHALRAKFASCRVGHIVDHAAVGEESAVHPHGREEARHGDRRAQGEAESPLVEDHGAARAQVGRDGTEAAGQLFNERVLSEESAKCAGDDACVEQTPAGFGGPSCDLAPAEPTRDPFERLSIETGRIARTHERARAGSGHDSRADATFFEHLQHPDVCRTERTAAAQRDREGVIVVCGIVRLIADRGAQVRAQFGFHFAWRLFLGGLPLAAAERARSMVVTLAVLARYFVGDSGAIGPKFLSRLA